MSDASATLPLEPQPAPRRRRRWWVIGAIVVLVLIVAFVVGEVIAKQYAATLVRERIVEVLDLDPATDVAVDLGEGSLLVQAALGRVDDVTVDIPQLTFGEISGAATLEAHGVPLDTTQPVRELAISATIDQSNVQALASYFSGIDLSTVELRKGFIRIGTDIDLAVLTLPVAVDLEPGVSEGGISFTPQSILVGEERLTVADLQSFPPLQGIASQLLASRDFCVASSLPRALEITSVDVVGSELRIGITGDGAALSGPDLSTKGTCPAG